MACGEIEYPIDKKEWDSKLIQYGTNIMKVLNKYDQLAQLLMMYPQMSLNYEKLMDNLLMIKEKRRLMQGVGNSQVDKD
ncbi:hypothetical protein DXF96_03570 [Heyndrickxia coagulans]|uniref:TetR/AcrR family transcriptional regulator C-terminal domain-containing protein n=1 Tax=Heyndrickxia coagulans TaxID=1398 RepID=UPI000D73E1B7|nr:hypothetical protein CYJ15_16095 [Heyndrickxia coagulans]QDI60687.1 hypothetical protein DXF96_03570 [Heyndrickxia coagulans]